MTVKMQLQYRKLQVWQTKKGFQSFKAGQQWWVKSYLRGFSEQMKK